MPSVSAGHRLAALGIGLLSVYTMLASQSATSIAAIAVTLTATMVLRLPTRLRKLMLIVGLVVGAVGVFAALNAGALNFVLALFGKDATLTGRTEGITAFQEAPGVGVGYQAWWVQGFSEPERLWEEFYIASRSGFHFHNTYNEVLVELGVIGLLMLLVVLFGTLAGHVRGLVSRGNKTRALVMFGLVVMLVVRSFVEVDVINPYAIGSFLLYYAAGVLGRRVPVAAPTRLAPHPLEFGRA